jgi:metal-dependent amidase/aminoacylase/carboxypeptidase family protein
MAAIGEGVLPHAVKRINASTDMGDVSHIIPSFHGAFSVPTSSGTAAHSRAFADAAATDEGHASALQTAKGMAMTALRVVLDRDLAERVYIDFKQPDE